jgi:hypothetical protein
MDEELLAQLLAVASVVVSPEVVSLGNKLVKKAKFSRTGHNPRCRGDNNRCDDYDTSVDDRGGHWRRRVRSH